jgi:glycosyltransferase involved in cell wall biosynthesis
MKKWAMDQVEKNKLRGNFIFLGRKPVEMMPNYYSRADAMLMSLTNTDLFSITIPSKLQSYLASKKPIIASINGEGAEIVKAWNAGMTCSATNPELLAETILQMSKLSPDELSEMGQNAFKCYQSEFERGKLIDFLETLFQST